MITMSINSLVGKSLCKAISNATVNCAFLSDKEQSEYIAHLNHCITERGENFHVNNSSHFGFVASWLCGNNKIRIETETQSFCLV